jgi:hypothetical protein
MKNCMTAVIPLQYSWMYRVIEIFFVRLATHLRCYVGTLDCQIQI